MTRFVFDVNVLVSALLFSDSVPGRAVTRALNSGTLLVSTDFVREVANVFGRNKFDRYIVRDERDRFLEALVRESELVDCTEQVNVCRDPKDDRILELALNGDASVIVTGDIDLLVLNPFRGVRIVTPDGIPGVAAPGVDYASEPGIRRRTRRISSSTRRVAAGRSMGPAFSGRAA